MNQDYALILQTDYEHITAALCKDTTILHTITCHKHEASKNLMLHLNTLLVAGDIAWNNLSFIAVNQGPAPFTTLRVIITTVNALAFAHNIPLIGIDGITTFLHALSSKTPIKLVLLNAFAQDLYYGIQDENGITTGWMHKDNLLHMIQSNYSHREIFCTGNGVLIVEKELTSLSPNVIIEKPLTHYTTFEALIATAYTNWYTKTHIHSSLLPLYLKTQEYKPSM